VQITPKPKGRPKRQRLEPTEIAEQVLADADLEEEFLEQELFAAQRKVRPTGGRPVVAFSAEAEQMRETLGTKRKVIGSAKKRSSQQRRSSSLHSVCGS